MASKTKVFQCGKKKNKLDPGYKGQSKIIKKKAEVENGVHK
jgi:hypothetical protein